MCDAVCRVAGLEMGKRHLLGRSWLERHRADKALRLNLSAQVNHHLQDMARWRQRAAIGTAAWKVRASEPGEGWDEAGGHLDRGGGPARPGGLERLGGHLGHRLAEGVVQLEDHALDEVRERPLVQVAHEDSEDVVVLRLLRARLASACCCAGRRHPADRRRTSTRWSGWNCPRLSASLTSHATAPAQTPTISRLKRRPQDEQTGGDCAEGGEGGSTVRRVEHRDLPVYVPDLQLQPWLAATAPWVPGREVVQLPRRAGSGK